MTLPSCPPFYDVFILTLSRLFVISHVFLCSSLSFITLKAWTFLEETKTKYLFNLRLSMIITLCIWKLGEIMPMIPDKKPFVNTSCKKQIEQLKMADCNLNVSDSYFLFENQLWETVCGDEICNGNSQGLFLLHGYMVKYNFKIILGVN